METMMPANASPENNVLSTPKESPNVPDLLKSSTDQYSSAADAAQMTTTSSAAFQNSAHVTLSGEASAAA